MPDCAAEVLTEEQITDLERKIGQLPTIKKLKENDNRIIEKLEMAEKRQDELKKGQEELENDVKAGFAKGKETMNSHSEKISILDRKVDTVEANIKEFIRLQNREVIDEVRSDKLKRLEDMLQKKDDELKKKREFMEKIKSGIILIVLGSIASYIAWSFKTVIGKA